MRKLLIGILLYKYSVVYDLSSLKYVSYVLKKRVNRVIELVRPLYSTTCAAAGLSLTYHTFSFYARFASTMILILLCSFGAYQ